jgi:hypothetical protein
MEWSTEIAAFYCRCQNFTLGLACCSEESFPCIGKDKLQEEAQQQEVESENISKSF